MSDELFPPVPPFNRRIDFDERVLKLRDRVKYLCLEAPLNCDCLKCRRIDDQFRRFIENEVHSLEKRELPEFKKRSVVLSEGLSEIENKSEVREK